MKARQGIDGYLHQLRAGLHLDPGTEGLVIGELSTYFEEKTAELRSEGGLPPGEAEQAAIRSLGPADELARMMYAAHSRAGWLEVLLACQPHLLFAGLCATGLWARPPVVVGLYLLTLMVSLLGWRRGRPAWVFAWVGYAFAPLLAALVVFRDEIGSAALQLLAPSSAAAAGPLAPALLLALACLAGLGLLLAAALRTARRDWLLLSFFTLPWPVLAHWLAGLEPAGLAAGAGGLTEAAAVPPLLLCAASSMFMRLRRRSHKGWALAAGAAAAALLLSLGPGGQVGAGALLGNGAAALAVLLLPAFMAGARHGGG